MLQGEVSECRVFKQLAPTVRASLRGNSEWKHRVDSSIESLSLGTRLFAHGGRVWKTAHTRVVLCAPQKGA